jgi:hypothetical protein
MGYRHSSLAELVQELLRRHFRISGTYWRMPASISSNIPELQHIGIKERQYV